MTFSRAFAPLPTLSAMEGRSLMGLAERFPSRCLSSDEGLTTRRNGWRPRPGKMRGWLRLALLGLTLLGSGCTSLREFVENGFKVGPNYQRPPAPLAPQWIDAR